MTAVNHVDTVTHWHSNASEEIPAYFNEQFCKQDIPFTFTQSLNFQHGNLQDEILK